MSDATPESRPDDSAERTPSSDPELGARADHPLDADYPDGEEAAELDDELSNPEQRPT